MNHVVVFCRRWVTWDGQPSGTSQPQRSSFQHDYQVQKLQELALRSWQTSGAQVIRHAMPCRCASSGARAGRRDGRATSSQVGDSDR
jgi:hypothetical protein